MFDDDSELALRGRVHPLRGLHAFSVKGQTAALSGSSLKGRPQLHNSTIAAHGGTDVGGCRQWGNDECGCVLTKLHLQRQCWAGVSPRSTGCRPHSKGTGPCNQLQLPWPTWTPGACWVTLFFSQSHASPLFLSSALFHGTTGLPVSQVPEREFSLLPSAQNQLTKAISWVCI